jgi:tetratricopeptide (TPR) repeat protein
MLTFIHALALALPFGSDGAAHATVLELTLRDAVDDLIATGRLALDEGKLDEAEQAFGAAAARDEARGSIWQMRVQLSRGAVDDVLGRLSSLRRKGQEGPDHTYLWGIAFATRVEMDLASGNTGNAGLMIKDARRELESACASDATRYRDAHLYLARICRHDGDHAASVAAAKRATEFYPKAVEAQELIGRGTLAQFAAVSADASKKAEADAFMAESVAAFTKAIDLVGRPRGGGDQALVSTLYAQLGDAHAFGKRTADASNAYAEAIGWEPAGFDYTRAYNVLGVDEMVKCLDAGRALFTKRAEPTDARMATVLWWQGYALFSQKDLARNEEAEKCFADCMALWPAYTNAWYYTARLRFDRSDLDGALAALRTLDALVDRSSGADAPRVNPELVALVQYDPKDVNRLFGIIEHCMGKTPAALEDAAFLTEIQCAAFPAQHDYWNNLGLFWRDAADLHVGRKGRTGMNDAERARFMPMYERSFEAYTQALDLSPGNPAYLNDGAVILHFYLERDYDRALAMYAEASSKAQERLAKGDLSDFERTVIETALRDSKDNRRQLERKIEAEKRREEKRKEEEERKKEEGGGAGD